MAYNLAPKAPADVSERRWTIPLAYDDSASAITATGATVTLDSYELDGVEAVFVVSGGSAGDVGAISVSITTDNGETITETLYVPVLDGTSSAPTANDIIRFALRKVFGNSGTPNASAASDALERLNDMLAEWREDGADVGATVLDTDTPLYVKASYVGAIKYGLMLRLADHYNREVSQVDMMEARRGLARIKNDRMADARTVDYY